MASVHFKNKHIEHMHNTGNNDERAVHMLDNSNQRRLADDAHKPTDPSIMRVVVKQKLIEVPLHVDWRVIFANSRRSGMVHLFNS